MADTIDSNHPVHDVLSRIRTLASGEDEVSLRALLAEFGETSFVPALMVPALLVISPLSGIPVFSSVMGLSIALIALQMLFARDHLWLPDVLLRRAVPAHRLCSAVDRIAPFGDWLDRRTAPRLSLLRVWPLSLLPVLACVLCGVAMPFLELVPFSSSILGTAVVCFAISFLARDGVFALIGAGVMGLAAIVPWFVIDRIT